MATPVFHPCRFNFANQDIRRIGTVTSGGTSLSGIDDPIEIDGGGFWRADFTDGSTRQPSQTLAWRSITARMDNGATAVVVEFCDRLHQPVGGEMGVAGSRQQFGDDRSYAQPGAIASTTASAPLRATTIAFSVASERPLIGGERFTIVHPNWQERCYEILTWDGANATIRPPLREAVAAGTALDFDNPRCKMRLPPGFNLSNALNLGRYGTCAISFVEDMRKPGDA